ncbi:unnamed protein product [Thlaspi arvense]|uniref:F-box domain-containing protein n=1 Tax=Thlaspi arvense TaxID=13288 RepID=A0AAU9S2S9_THLAR|nr:unnamed protein product [Thlaspi arvense]
MESQEGSSGNVLRWENLDREVLSTILKKLDVVDVITGASRVCITWFLASHNKSLWNTIKLNDLDWGSFEDTYREKQRREILIEINKFGRTAPINFFFSVHCNVLEEDLAIISTGLPNIRKLALPTWRTLKLKSIQSAFSKWKNLQTLIIAQFMRSGGALNFEFRTIADNCRNLTTIKFTYILDKELAKIIVRKLPNVERLSFRCATICGVAVISLVIGLPNLKILNLSHCILTETRYCDRAADMKYKQELVKFGAEKLEKIIVCCSNCTICENVWKYTIVYRSPTPEYRSFWDKQWKTDEIEEFEF